MTKPLETHELSAIRARLSGCVDGPWIHRGDGFIETADHRVIGVTCAGNGDCGGNVKLPRVAHGQFLAAAREDIPRLLAEVDRLREEVERLCAQPATEPPPKNVVPAPKAPVAFGVR